MLVSATTYRVSCPFELLGQLRNVSNYYKVKQVFTLGKWPILISSFGIDDKGEIYVSDYSTGNIYKINIQ